MIGLVHSTANATCPRPILQCGQIREKQALKRCVACQSFYYCDRNCQEVDWRVGGHRAACSPGNSAHLSKSSLCPPEIHPTIYFRWDFYAQPRSPRETISACIGHPRLSRSKVDRYLPAEGGVHGSPPWGTILHAFRLPAWPRENHHAGRGRVPRVRLFRRIPRAA